MTDEVVQTEAHHEAGKRRPEIRWGVVASVVAHIPIVALLIFGLPKIQPKPAEDESVKVELVPPPEEKKPEVKPPEPKPPEQVKKQPPPPPPPPQEEAKKEAPPPPPPPEAKKEPPQPPSPSENAKPQPRAPLTIRPVFEFADKDTAPEQSEKGLPKQAEAPKPPVAEAKPEVPVEPPQPEKPEATKAPAAANPVPEDVALPQIETAEANPEKNGPAASGPDEAKTNFEQAKPPEDETASAPPALSDVKAEESNKVSKAKTSSDKAATDTTVKTAMGNRSRQTRGGQLCWTKLREQLLASSAAYDPNVIRVPLYNFPDGNVLTLKRSALYDGQQLYNLAFTCELNDNATKVESLEFSVGNVIPKNEWESRHFDPNR